MIAVDRRFGDASYLSLLRAHGYLATSFHLARRVFRVWEDTASGAAIAFVETGSAWVASGSPVGPPEAFVSAVTGFVAAARAAGKRAAFFGVERRLLDNCPAVSALCVGEQPVWDPQRWESTRQSSPQLRYQLGRARRKGIVTRWLEGDDLARELPALTSLVEDWQAARRMPPMGFQVHVELGDVVDERRYLAAYDGDRLIGAIVSSPVYSRRGHYLEHALRRPYAPNGVVELLFDTFLQQIAREGSAYATLGLAPLRGDVAPLLRWSRRLGEPLYRFEGLSAFKERLAPDRWDPLHIAFPRGALPALAVVDVLRAFAGGSFVAFGLRLGARWLPRARALPSRPDL